MTATYSTGRLGPVFDQAGGITLNVDNPRRVEFTANRESRTIKGLALPYGDVASTGGRKYRFAKGALRWAKVRLLAGHDWSQLLGTATFEETDEGLVMSAKVANTRAGDDALALAESGALDGLSVGLAEQLRTTFDQAAGVHDVKAGTVLEVSLTPIPAFERAGIRSVAAEADRTPDQPPAQPAAGATFDLGADPRFSQLASQVNQIGAQMDFIAALPQQGTPHAVVKEESVYRFAGDTPAASGFDFATDLLAAATQNDREALARVVKFTDDVTAGRVANPLHTMDQAQVAAAFADTAGVAGNLPTQYDPSLFLGDRPFPASPMFDYFNRGARQTWLPFTYGVLTRGTVPELADHTEGVDPALDNIATTMHAAVDPAPVSGRVHITREVGELGGSPSVSALVWAQYDISLALIREAKTTALVTGSAPAPLNTTGVAAGASGAVLGAAIRRGLALLPFQRQAIARGFLQADTFAQLATADSTTGEPLFPIGPMTNRQGSSQSQYSALTIGGYPFLPGTALAPAGQADATNSYMAGPNAVHVWSSGLTRLSMLQETVEGWDLGAWSWFAGVLYDLNELRLISYDPAGA